MPSSRRKFWEYLGISSSTIIVWLLVLKIHLKYLRLIFPPTYLLKYLWSLIHEPSKYYWSEVTAVYRCFERFQASSRVGREDGDPHQVNYQLGDEQTGDEINSTPCTQQSPCHGESWPGLSNCEGGYEAVFSFYLFASIVISLCSRHSSRLQNSRQNFRSPNLSSYSLGFRLNHRGWTWWSTIITTHFMFGVGADGGE